MRSAGGCPGPAGRGAGAGQLLAVVEGQRFHIGEAGVRAPACDEGHGLVDLALPVVRRPAGDGAGAPAEVAVEVRAYLVPVEPRLTDVLQGGADVLVLEVADVGCADRVVGRPVQAPLRLGQQVDAGEEEGHGRAVVLGELEEAREETVSDLPRAVPAEDDELRRRLARLERHGPVGLVGLRAGVGGGAVTDGLGRRLAGLRILHGSGCAGTGHIGQSAAGDSHRGRGAKSQSQQPPPTDSPDVAHVTVPIVVTTPDSKSI